MASVNPLEKLRFKFRTKRDGTHDAVAASVPQPTTTGSTAGRLSPHPAVLKASPALQETSDSLYSTQSLPERLWNRAYDALKEEDPQLVDTYERLLSHQLEGDPTSTDLSSQKNSIEQGSSEKRRYQMTQLVVAGLEKTGREANIKRDVEKGMQVVSSAKALMDTAVKAYPEASLAWAGVCIILEMLANPVKQTSANREGIAYVISRMEWYWRLSSLLLDENKAKGNHGGLRDELEKHVIALYKTLLAYQMKSVYSYYRSRHVVFWRDVITLDDWSGTLEAVYHAEKTVQEDSAAYNTESIKGHLENLAEAAKSQQETLLPGIHQAFRDHTAAQREMLQEKETMECLKHLRATDPRDDKKRIERIKGGFLTDASNWILHHPDFRHWRDDAQSQLLWIKGDPGKGKTMLLIGIIKELELTSALADNLTAKPAVLSYFFCQRSDSRLNNATAVLRGLIYLLVVQQPLLMSHLWKKYDHAGEGLFKDVNAFVALSEVFATMLRDPSITKAYIIVDALDECETDQKQLLDLIAENASASPRVKWIVSSRNRRDIERQLKLEDSGMKICLEMTHNAAAFYRPGKPHFKSWFEYSRGYFILSSYLWPEGEPWLQLLVLLSFLLIVGQRIVNILMPIQIGIIANTLLLSDRMPWEMLAWLMTFKFLHGGAGLLASTRSLLWIPVAQYSYRSLATAAFEHAHSLGLEFYLSKRTGEVLSTLNKASSVNQYLEQITFQVLPMLFDIIIAIIYFCSYYNAIYGAIIAIFAWSYLYFQIYLSRTRDDERHDMNEADQEEEAVKNDSITSYETVKYFNAEQYEFRRYKNSLQNFQDIQLKCFHGASTISICRTLAMISGFLIVTTLGAYEVSYGLRDVGSFVTLVAYFQQLQSPLDIFGTLCRPIGLAMMFAERFLELFKVQPAVVDSPNAKKLDRCEGRIRWSGVKFSYDWRKPTLQDLSFECVPGTTTAFVGESGGGKSTVFRLLYRYFNFNGSVEIDGHDVRELTIDSVRRHMGVVPQHTILFNETLMYNLRYANQNATDEEIFAACRLANIHDRIMTFPEGYRTEVGERGLRLSGGERQRVAIARMLLKNPKIMMLDEAMSSLDSSTEQEIQKGLRSVGKGRTMLIIAHRLSTVTHADQILVLHGGRIVEKGTHAELLALNGRYALMWEKQCTANEVVEERLPTPTSAG